MAEVDRNLYLDMGATYTDDDGTTRFGVYREGWRDPETHAIHFGEPKDATDAAKERAREAGISVQEVEGTGQGGRVTADDVAKATEG